MNSAFNILMFFCKLSFRIIFLYIGTLPFRKNRFSIVYLNTHVLGKEGAGKGDHEEKEAPYAGNLEKMISKEKKQKQCEIQLNQFLSQFTCLWKPGRVRGELVVTWTKPSSPSPENRNVMVISHVKKWLQLIFSTFIMNGRQNMPGAAITTLEVTTWKRCHEKLG